MKTLGLAVLLLLFAAPAYAQPDLRAHGVALALMQATQDAQQAAPIVPPCTEVKVGNCIKLPPTGLDHFVTVAVIADNVCAFYDITSTLAGTVTGELVEQNTWLAPFASNAALMTTTRAAVQVVKWAIFRAMKNRGPTWKLWTGITASATAGIGCGAAVHNTLEMNR